MPPGANRPASRPYPLPIPLDPLYHPVVPQYLQGMIDVRAPARTTRQLAEVDDDLQAAVPVEVYRPIGVPLQELPPQLVMSQKTNRITAAMAIGAAIRAAAAMRD